MRITKRQLKRIIKEELTRLSEIGTDRGYKQASVGNAGAYEAGVAAGREGDRSEMPLDQYGTAFYDAWMEGWDDGLAYFHSQGLGAR